MRTAEILAGFENSETECGPTSTCENWRAMCLQERSAKARSLDGVNGGKNPNR